MTCEAIRGLPRTADHVLRAELRARLTIGDAYTGAGTWAVITG
jgi:hypothetical protein